MFSAKTMMISAALAVTGSALAVSGAAQAGVVVKSSGPSSSTYPVGKKLDDDGRITLKAGDAVTVLANGTTRVISGPGTHQVSARGSSRRGALRTLTTQRSVARARVGASRGDETAASIVNPNLWWIDVSKSGTMCLSDLTAVDMWRPAIEGASTYVFASTSSADHIHVNFPDGEMTAAWDAARMPLTEGATYMITGPAGGEPQEMVFTAIEAPTESAEDLAVILIEKGCTAQLELLADALQ